MDAVVKNLLRDNIKAVIEAGGTVAYAYSPTVDSWLETIHLHKSQLPSYKGRYVSLELQPQFESLATNDERLDFYMDYIFNPKNVAMVYLAMRTSGLEPTDFSNRDLKKYVEKYQEEMTQ